MTERTLYATISLVLIISMSVIGLGTAYAIEIQPAEDLVITAIWNIIDAPMEPFESFWTGGGYWDVSPPDNMTFKIGGINDEVTGSLGLGNMTVLTNDTMIARDLTLGVWGVVEFSPGLFIKTGSSNIELLNSTAFEAVQRVKWNYLNGTMNSYYDNYEIRGVKQDCIVFEYQQDPTASGTPQYTQLVYSLSTGILLYGNTSYYFGEPFQPYNFVIEFITLEYSGTIPNPMVLYTILFLIVVIIGVSIFLKKR